MCKLYSIKRIYIERVLCLCVRACASWQVSKEERLVAIKLTTGIRRVRGRERERE